MLTSFPVVMSSKAGSRATHIMSGFKLVYGSKQTVNIDNSLIASQGTFTTENIFYARGIYARKIDSS